MSNPRVLERLGEPSLDDVHLFTRHLRVEQVAWDIGASRAFKQRGRRPYQMIAVPGKG